MTNPPRSSCICRGTDYRAACPVHGGNKWPPVPPEPRPHPDEAIAQLVDEATHDLKKSRRLA